ncbi:MAG: PLP-dependent aminotransferase family protein [Polyangiaceae bacterium]
MTLEDRPQRREPTATRPSPGFLLELRDGPLPLFLRIAQAVEGDIRRGRLQPGAVLPGSRSLASSLGVHRNTVLAAYRELEAQGLIETVEAKGTRVSSALPAPSRARSRPASRAERSRAPFDLAPCPPETVFRPPPTTARPIMLLGGVPDLRRVPRVALARAYRRALLASAGDILGYGDPRGEERLRAALAALLSETRGLSIDAESVLVARGSQQALYLAARTVLAPGDVVAVEEFGYSPAWEALRAAGATLVPVPVDARGLDVSSLERLVAGRGVRAVYVTPHHQYPTTVLMAPERREALLALARTARLAIFEDDYDHEFHYAGRPVAPLAASDDSGHVIYLGTLSKILAPGLRVGFVAATRPVLDAMVRHRTILDRQGDRTLERAVADLIEDGEVRRHARRMRRVYEARRAVLAESLRAHLADHLTFELPAGGMAVWAAVRGLPVRAWAEACALRGVLFQAGERFAFDGRDRAFIRLGYGAETENRIATGVRKMAEAARSLVNRRL